MASYLEYISDKEKEIKVSFEGEQERVWKMMVLVGRNFATDNWNQTDRDNLMYVWIDPKQRYKILDVLKYWKENRKRKRKKTRRTSIWSYVFGKVDKYTESDDTSESD